METLKGSTARFIYDVEDDEKQRMTDDHNQQAANKAELLYKAIEEADSRIIEAATKTGLLSPKEVNTLNRNELVYLAERRMSRL